MFLLSPSRSRVWSARRVRPAAFALAVLAIGADPARAQTLDDGLMVPRRQLRTTVEYAHERWDSYWEGELKRQNDNIGTVTTRSVAWTGAYGVTERFSVFATLPYLWTSASQGVLQGMEGRQDLTVAAKFRVLQAAVSPRATLGLTALVGVGVPTSDYTPDFQPLSIGLGARRALARGALHLHDRSGVFAEASAAQTWRSTVRLDRPAYYTDGDLVLSDEVAMPDVFEYAVGTGFQNARWCIPVMLVSQRTLGGGDIRRQDMPFVSNRMDFTRLQARVMYTVPRLPAVTLQLGAMHTLTGRNVGQSTLLSGGLTSAIRL